MELTERVNLDKCKYLLTLSFATMKKMKLFKKAKDEEEKQKLYNTVKKFCEAHVKCKGQIRRIYAKPQSTPGEVDSRLYCGHSAQSLPGEFRRFFFGDSTTDLDMKNCHPVILRYICWKHRIPSPELNMYITNREEILSGFPDREAAKSMFLAAVNTDKERKSERNKTFRKFDKEMKEIHKQILALAEYKAIVDTVPSTSDNKNGSAINRIMCSYEDQVLKVIVGALNQYGGLEIAALMFDGLNIYGTEHAGNDSLLEFVQSEIEKTFPDLQMELAYKEQECEILELPEAAVGEAAEDSKMTPQEQFEQEIQRRVNDKETIVLPSGKTVDVTMELYGACHTELLAAQKMLELYPHFKFCNGNLYMFDIETGMYTTDKDGSMAKIIGLHSDFLHGNSQGKQATTLYNARHLHDAYGNSDTKITKLLHLICSLCVDNEWESRTSESSLGYLLFRNGILDGTRRCFYDKQTHGFNPDIVFHGRINRDYTEHASQEDKEYMASIFKRVFVDPLDEEAGEHLLYLASRALFGDYMKAIVIGIGQSDCGKSSLASCFKFALGEGSCSYYGTFSANYWAAKSGDTDHAAQNRWLLLLRYKRLLFSNEISAVKKLDANMMKSQTGGDVMVGRVHGGLEIPFKPHSLPFAFMNDTEFPDDPALRTRLQIFNYEKQFSLEPTEFQLQLDPNFGQEMQTDRFCNCFLMLLFRKYFEYVKSQELEESECVSAGGGGGGGGKRKYVAIKIPDSVKQAKLDWVGDGSGDTCIMDKFVRGFEFTGNAEDYVSSKMCRDFLKAQNSLLSINKLNKEIQLYVKSKRIENVHRSVKRIIVSSTTTTEKVWVGVKKVFGDEDTEEA
jgi:hypothetical protein